MREPLENGAPQSYERPSQPWVCGLASDGRACPAGPTARGVCPALAECTPRRDGDRWRCNRSALRGGPCDEGPTPDGRCPCVQHCTPQRSLRAMRGRFVTACSLATAGALLMLLSANWRDEFISPGSLAQQHAQLTAPGGAMQCSACHAAANQGLAGWSASLLVGHGDTPIQSQLCMKCHAEMIDSKFFLAAHNVPAEELAEITGGVETSAHQLACATCHHEHRGTGQDLAAMDNRSCQACHQRRYESFASDHPEFGVWPYERRTRIVFDHVAHQAKHFAEKKQPFDCRSCHVEDATQSIELLAGYGAACAACHSENIQTSVALGVPMFVVPTVDVDALRAVGVDVGPWPEEATGDFDGRLPAAMKLLLAADPPAAEAMVTLGADFDFFDVDPDDEEQLRAAGKLAAAIKRLMAELSEVGPKAVRRRLSVMTGREIADEELNALVAGLSVDTLRPAVAEWLPDSAGGDGPWNRGDTSNGDEVRSDDGTDASVISFDPAGTWTRDDATLSIRYRPTGHADPVLATWLTATVELPNALGLPLKAALVKELTKPTAPGQCGSCHSVEGSKSGQLMVNWHAFNRLSEQRTLTKFDHGPHLLLPQLADCTACHALDPAANTAASYADYDPHTFVSEFLPISKRDCVQCHTPIAAGDHCQTCHNYHVDMVESWRRASRP